jgi:hypothetical protein
LFVNRTLQSTAGGLVGSLDEVSFFKKGLSQADVTALRAAGIAKQSVPACTTCVKPDIHFALDDDSDPTVADLAGASPGQNAGASVPVPGKVAGAALFVDAADRNEIPNTPAQNPSVAITLAMWVRPTALLNAGDSAIFFNKLTSGTGYRMSSGGNGGFRFTAGDKFADSPTSLAFAAGTWHHLAGVWDGAEVRIFVDGAVAGNAPKTTPLVANAGIATISTANNTLTPAFFGAVDEVVLYDLALSDAQILELYNLGNSGKPVPH